MTVHKYAKSILTFSLITLAPIHFCAACGQNQLKARAPASPYEEAQNKMENGDYLSARTLLEAIIEENPHNERAIALLAATYAAEVGISIIDLTEKGLQSDSAADSGLASIVPDATEVNLQIVKTAKDLIITIPEENRVQDMSLGATIYVTVYGIMLITYLAQSDHIPTPEDLLEIISSLDQASELASANGIPADQINAIQAAIESQSGETNEDKVSAYLEQVRVQGGILPESSVVVSSSTSE